MIHTERRAAKELFSAARLIILLYLGRIKPEPCFTSYSVPRTGVCFPVSNERDHILKSTRSSRAATPKAAHSRSEEKLRSTRLRTGVLT